MNPKRPTRWVRTLAAMAALLGAGLMPTWSVHAQTPTAPAPVASLERVVVSSSLRDPDWKTYKAYVAGMDAFDAQRDALAPHAALKFLLVPTSQQAELAGTRLSIEGDDTAIPVPVSAEGAFVLPRDQKALEQGAELALNRKKGLYRWRADVRSSEVPDGMRRLGDLRLECEVRWAVERADIFAPFRAMLSRAGACDSKRVRVEFMSNRPLAAVYLVHGNRREALPRARIEDNGFVYTPPLHDSSWPNETLLEFAYQ